MKQQTPTRFDNPKTLEAVRPRVRDMLMAIPAFAGLDRKEQQELARNMVKVFSYIANPEGMEDERLAKGVLRQPLAEAQRGDEEDPVEATKRSLSQSPGMVGQDFTAGAVREGVEQFGALVQKVDFPKFVGGLIQAVFQAIVESSIEQMRAYGDLLANVAKTVDQFMVDNISAGAGRDWLAERYPDDFSVNLEAGAGEFSEEAEAPPVTARLAAQGENPEQRLGKISRDLNLDPPVTNITDANAEQRLVTAARLHMAKSRQQLLSSMVMLGINRIVVTDGSIRAKVVFDMRAKDTAKRRYTASMHDRSAQRYRQRVDVSYGAWYSPLDMSASFEGEQEHVATVDSAVDETSESKAEVKSSLTGEVRVNFKSDYLPLEKMATPEMISTIQGNSTPFNPNRAGGAAQT